MEDILQPLVVIHGGAWAIPDALVENSLKGVEKAAEIALKLLKSGKHALDAVEAAVISLEDNPAFDAGIGSVLTSKGEVEMDAMIMEGENLQCGAVACVKNVKNPIKLAHHVMKNTDHVMLVGSGAVDYAKENNFELISTKELVTPEAIQDWEIFVKYNKAVKTLFNSTVTNGSTNGVHDLNGNHHGHDTVGCVVRDRNGNLACGTSTGGITCKRPGRVGDCPLIGSGGYADNNSAAISCTGHGESIAKVCLAKSIADCCSNGETVQQSVEKCLAYMKSRVKGAGGAICVDKEGNYGLYFTTERMAWAVGDNNGIKSGIEGSDLESIGIHYS